MMCKLNHNTYAVNVTHILTLLIEAKSFTKPGVKTR